jgi:hypothetical protein
VVFQGPPSGWRVETTVRRLAGSLIAALPARVREVVALPVEKQALGAWAREVDWSGWPDQVVSMVADEARTSSDDQSYVDQLVKRHDDPLGRLRDDETDQPPVLVVKDAS